MKEAVDDILALRAPDPTGLSRMMTFSFAAHISVVAAVLLIPKNWLFREKPPVATMTISLGGSGGAQTSGMSPAGARPVEQATPEPKRPEIVKPAAAKPDVMTIPVKPTKAAPVKPSDVPKPSAANTPPPPTGRQVQPGTSRAETGATGLGTGLTLGGGGASGQLQMSDFCCPGYLKDMEAAIKSNGWDEHQAERGEVVVKFTILRDGRLTDVQVERGATFLLDNASRRPLLTLRLKPLPPEFPESTLTIHLTFVYK